MALDSLIIMYLCAGQFFQSMLKKTVAYKEEQRKPKSLFCSKIFLCICYICSYIPQEVL